MRALVRARGIDRCFCPSHQRCDSLHFNGRSFDFGGQDLSQLFYATAGQATSYQGRCKLGSTLHRLCALAGADASGPHTVGQICNPQPFFCQSYLLPSASGFPIILLVSS